MESLNSYDRWMNFDNEYEEECRQWMESGFDCSFTVYQDIMCEDEPEIIHSEERTKAFNLRECFDTARIFFKNLAAIPNGEKPYGLSRPETEKMDLRKLEKEIERILNDESRYQFYYNHYYNSEQIVTEAVLNEEIFDNSDKNLKGKLIGFMMYHK